MTTVGVFTFTDLCALWMRSFTEASGDVVHISNVKYSSSAKACTHLCV